MLKIKHQKKNFLEGLTKGDHGENITKVVFLRKNDIMI